MLEYSLRSVEKIIGRIEELDAIDAVLADPSSYHHVFYLEGQGGIGKTRLLLEAKFRAQSFENVLTTDIIDLYLTRHHQPLGIMHSIAIDLLKSLQECQKSPTPDVFSNYFQAHSEFLSRRNQFDAVNRQSIVDEAFLKDYERLTTQESFSVVLLIDTLEKLHPQIAETELFNFRQSNRLERWLIEMVARLPNTLTLVAGRPREKQRELLETTLKVENAPSFTLFSIKPFDQEETKSYVMELATECSVEIDLSEEMIQTLHRVSGGRPVILAIATACAQAEAFDIEALPAAFDDTITEDQKQAVSDFVGLMVSDIHQHRPDLADFLTKAVYMRKGLRKELLSHIYQREVFENAEQNEIDVTEQTLKEFTRLSFVKDVGGQIILHDEMYELLFGRLSEGDVSRWYSMAIFYLDQQIEQRRSTRGIDSYDEEEVDETDSEASGVVVPGYDHRGSITNAQAIQTLQVERLFYRLALDPQAGYQEYKKLINYAIQAYDEDFDTQLQDEFARFYDENTSWGKFYRDKLIYTQGINWDKVMFQEGIFWVYRCMASQVLGSDRYSLAVNTANRVKQQYRHIYKENTLARCELDVAQIRAESMKAERTTREQQVVEGIETVEQELHETIFNAKTILANAYNYWGYHERLQQNMHSAIQKYEQSIVLFQELGQPFDTLRATVLNNLGYALSRQGRSEEGLAKVEEGLQIAEATGLLSSVATAYNTRAQVRMDLGNVLGAEQDVRKARRLFEAQRHTRGLALCAQAEGRLGSQLLRKREGDYQELYRHYQRSVTRYLEAINLFDQVGGELTRRIELRLWVAFVFRDWGEICKLHGKAWEEHFEKAMYYLQEALKICRAERPPILPFATTLEYLGHFYALQGDFAQARAYLEEVRREIPGVYSIESGKGIVDTVETREFRIFWLRLGFVEFYFALCDFGEQNYHGGFLHLTRAIAYMYTYMPTAKPLVGFYIRAKDEMNKIADRHQIQVILDDVNQYIEQNSLNSDAMIKLREIFQEAILTHP